jgi:DUF4097 and DUF4098 domain-containing protein YvlB
MQKWWMVAALAAAVAGAQDFRWAGVLNAGQKVEIKGINGNIKAARATGAQVEVTAVKSGRDAANVKVEAHPHNGGVTVCAVYPGEGNACGPGRDGKARTENNDARVDFTVAVPAGVLLRANTVNGTIEVEDVGDVRGATVNGNIRALGVGLAELSSVNGNVEAELGRTPDRALKFSTVNGNIDVRVSGTLNADVKASTVSGQIQTDLPLAVKKGIVGQALNGTLGNGGPEMKLSTVNGSVSLRGGGRSI